MNWAGGQLGLLWIRPMESDLALTLDLSLGYGKLWVASPLNGSRRDEVEKQSVGMLGGSLGSTLELAVSESFRVGLRMGASQFRGTKSEETTAVAAEPTTRLATERHHAVVATLIEASFVIGWSL